MITNSPVTVGILSIYYFNDKDRESLSVVYKNKKREEEKIMTTEKMPTDLLDTAVMIGEEYEDTLKQSMPKMQHMFTEEQEATIAAARLNAVKTCFPGSREMKVKVTFIDSALGMSPNDKDVYRDFIASKAPDAMKIEEEVASVGVDETEEKGITVFPRNQHGRPCAFDYQWKGFFKDACSLLSRSAGKDPETGKKLPSNYSSRMTAYKKVIDGNIFVSPRMIEFHMPEGAEMGELSRPLRAETAQGPRVALAKSEKLPAMSTAEFSVLSMNPGDCAAIEEWLTYGCLHGFGQWRNGGFGVFVWEKLEDWHTVGTPVSTEPTEEAPKKRGRKKKEA